MIACLMSTFCFCMFFSVLDFAVNMHRIYMYYSLHWEELLRIKIMLQPVTCRLAGKLCIIIVYSLNWGQVYHVCSPSLILRYFILYIEYFLNPNFLAHLSTKCSGWAIVTGLCPSSVVVRRPSCVVRCASCVNFFT